MKGIAEILIGRTSSGKKWKTVFTLYIGDRKLMSSKIDETGGEDIEGIISNCEKIAKDYGLKMKSEGVFEYHLINGKQSQGNKKVKCDYVPKKACYVFMKNLSDMLID